MAVEVNAEPYDRNDGTSESASMSTPLFNSVCNGKNPSRRSQELRSKPIDEKRLVELTHPQPQPPAESIRLAIERMALLVEDVDDGSA